ncbi:response regulator transcription factor [Spirosoma sp. KCTC 42546]|uniref:LytR/AlgR family response regulator transcription factor n=1 Tax=Spirosoma sp. KCTC 42546 TaxID=2520506 RepID=UPI00115ACA6B|nr:LytTR family DNA-binding domain-containing protein [Spirosoma sp. KCTC 42546]QDK77712.1 response regulator transcription factor [Spirosoma sp. KCTC 42546]
MTTYRSLIIDDEVLARGVIRTFLKADPSIVVVDEAGNGTEAVIKILQYRPDLIFLDIQMPELDGFEVLKEIWPHHQPFVVFTTAYDQYALKAFEVNAIDYLLKPFNEMRFHQALGRVQERLAQQTQPRIEALVNQLMADQTTQPKSAYLRRILVKETGRMYFVKTNDIMYLDADGNYITLHTATSSDGYVGVERHVIYDSLTSLETKLDPTDFVRIHRSYIVNLNYIDEVETYFNGDYMVKLKNGQQLKWTRNYRDNLKAFYSKSA